MTDAVLCRLKKILSAQPVESLDLPLSIPAAVLLLIYLKGEDYYVHFQKRSQQVAIHRGEICLPGGRKSSTDNNLLSTALRETSEESGISPESVTDLGQLNDVQTITGYVLKVFVGTISSTASFKPNPAEVEELIEIPLSALQSPTSRRIETYWNNGCSINKSAYAYHPHIIYGATAAILEQFLIHINKALSKKEA